MGKVKNIIIFILVTGLSSGLTAQPYGHEWIDFDQSYYKIRIARDGIYRITYDDLLQAGIMDQDPDPRDIQVFHRGKEMAIQVRGELDASFDPGDFILFYGQRNDGDLDSLLYKNGAQPHAYYNLYSDSSGYFLTWRLDAGRGKRIQEITNTDNIDNLPPENYHSAKEMHLFTDNFSNGLNYPFYATNPEVNDARFDFGEGWTGTAYRQGQTIVDTIMNINNRYDSGPGPELEIILAGRNNLSHNVTVQAGPSGSSLREIGTVEFERHYTETFRASLEWADISPGGELYINLNINGVDGNADRVSVSLITLNFPQEYHTGGASMKKFRLQPNPENESYIEIDGINDPGTLWDITDPYTIREIDYPAPGGTLNTVVPGTAQGKTLLYTEDILPIDNLNAVEFQEINPSGYDYLMIYHRDFTSGTPDYANPVEAYVNYRSSEQGGNFSPLAMDIQMLYDQFHYGEISPAAVRKFCRYMLDNGQPEYLFLIGKGLTVNHDYYRNIGSAEFTSIKDWVPTAGNPGSDILFTSGLNGSGIAPAIPTGRFPAKSAQEVANYLNKVIETEEFGFDALWKKDIIQLSGGIRNREHILFRSYIEEFEDSLSGPYLGGKSINISKTTTNSVEQINISEEVNKGKSLILFFGHSGANISDIEIGNVSNDQLGYNNQGKYPLIFMNGCNAGNIFTTNLSFGEDWMVGADRGSIAFSAHADAGYTDRLYKYSKQFIATGYQDSINIARSLGYIVQQTASRFYNLSPKAMKDSAQVEQTVLQADPAVKLFGAGEPDYSINDEQVFLQGPGGSVVTAVLDSFYVAMVIKNFGRTDKKPFQVMVKHTLPDGTVDYPDTTTFDPVYYQDTLYFTIRTTGQEIVGQNTFEITIDPLDSIAELSETNNTAVFQSIIKIPGTQNLYPYDFSIVPDDTVTFVAQATDINNLTRQFIFELDTTPDFNSPGFQTFSIPGENLVEWEASLFNNIPLSDSVVFYWRSRFGDVQGLETGNWSESSFMYIENGPEGWAQARDPQLLQNELNDLVYDENQGRWSFETISTTIEVVTFGRDHPDKDYTDVSLEINGNPYIYETRLCSNNSINALAFDQTTNNPYLVLPFGEFDILDRRSCGRQPQVINNFLNSEITGPEDYLTQYIDAVNEGDYVLLFTIGEVNFESWPQQIKDKLLEIGASPATLDSLKNGEPLILLGRKGEMEGNATEITATDAAEIPLTEQQISLNTEIEGRATSGSVITGTLGPSRNWETMYNTVGGREDPEQEDHLFTVYGVDADFNETMLISEVESREQDLSFIDAAVYPYLRIRFRTSDTVNYTPARLKQWIVTYQPYPEGVVLPAENQAVKDIEKQEGEPFPARFLFYNISHKAFDDSALFVQHILVNENTLSRRTDSLTISAPSPRDSTVFNIDINSIQMAGPNDLILTVNPRRVPEKFYINNTLDLHQFALIGRDMTDPVIDVTIDGRYILDGEIVSPSPFIKIIFKDDNPYLHKQDTTGIHLSLKTPGSGNFSSIAFSDPNLTWSPASEENDFSIEYRSPRLEDGIYTLSVQAKDESGNEVGEKPYEISFEVINESRITHFYPFPNPFSSSTRFVFTLTGSQVPERIKIQIMTVSGKVVREITHEEIGPIHIGNNITEYAWDGRDEFGDQLANGVYLYRVLIDNPGENFKHRETAGDAGFKKEYGKLYILR